MSKPTPLSRTNTAGWPSQIIWSTWMVARWRGRVYLIAFKSRLANTCLIKPGSHSTVGRRPICHSISRPSISGWRLSHTSLTSESKSVLRRVSSLRVTRAELVRLPPHKLRLPGQVHKDGNLRPQNLRHNRLENVIHRPYRITPEYVCLAFVSGGEEDDGDILGTVALPDQLGGLEAIHVRHLDIEQNERKVGLEKLPQRLAPRTGLDDVAFGSF